MIGSTQGLARIGCGVILAAIMFVLSPAAQGSRLLDQHWQQLETNHFCLIYPKHEKMQAAHIAAVAEERYAQVAELCGYQPHGKIPLVLNNDTDLANAFAQSIFKKIEFNLAPSLDNEFGSGDKDWWTLVFLHEYAHLCQGMRDDAGVSHLLSTIFGEVNGLNFVAPRWWVEGVAVYAESELTGGGRLNNSYYQLELAADILANRPLSRAQLANPPKVDRPWGRNYFWGADLIAAVQSRQDHVSVVNLVSREQCTWPFWGLDVVWQNAMGLSLDADWKHMQQQKKNDFIKNDPNTGLPMAKAKRLTDEPDVEYASPQWMDQNRIVVLKNSLDAGKIIVTIDSRTRKEQVWQKDIELQGHLDWQPQEKRLYFSTLTVNPFEPNARQACPYELKEGGKVHACGREKRLWSLDVSRQGFEAAIANDQGQARLMVKDIQGQGWRFIAAPAEAHFRDPRWSPAGHRLAVVVTFNGRQDICLIDPQSQHVLAITGWDEAADLDPAWSSDGQWLYFISDRVQGYQLFAWSLQTHQLFQLSHARLGVFQPDLSPDATRVVMVTYEKGHQQHLLVAPLDRSTWTLVTTTTPVSGWPVVPAAVQTTKLTGTAPYNPWLYLAPTFWVPALGWGQKGVLLGAFSAQRDPLEFHEWQAQVLFGLQSGNPYGSLTYQNNQWPLSWSLHANYEPTNQLILGGVSDRYLGWGRRAGLDLTLNTTFWKHLTRDWATATSWQGVVGSAFYTADQPVAYPKALFAKTSVGFFHGRQGPRDFFPVQGLSLSLGWEQSLLRSWNDGQALTWSSTFYLPGLVRHQAWQLGLRGKKQSGRFSENNGAYASSGFGQEWQAAGNQATFSAGYNLPLWMIDQGWSEWPVFFNDLWMKLNYDSGLAWEGPLDFSEQRHHAQSSLALETTLDMTLFWYLTSAVRGTIIYRLEPRDWLAQVGGQIWF